VVAYVESIQTLKDLKKGEGLFCGSFLRKGEVFVNVGLHQTLKDLYVLTEFAKFAIGKLIIDFNTIRI